MSVSAFQVQEKLAQLEEALTSAHPNITTLLRDIHQHLKQDPDVVTVLTEEECSTLVAGLSKQTGVEISAAALKTGAKKPLSKLTVDDL